MTSENHRQRKISKRQYEYLLILGANEEQIAGLTSGEASDLIEQLKSQRKPLTRPTPRQIEHIKDLCLELDIPLVRLPQTPDHASEIIDALHCLNLSNPSDPEHAAAQETLKWISGATTRGIEDRDTLMRRGFFGGIGFLFAIFVVLVVIPAAALFLIIVLGGTMGAVGSATRASVEAAERKAKEVDQDYIDSLPQGYEQIREIFKQIREKHGEQTLDDFIHSGFQRGTIKPGYGGSGVSYMSILAELNQPEHIATLLDAGENPNNRDPNGMGPLYYAAKGQCDECAGILFEAGARVTMDELRAIAAINKPMAERLLARDAVID